MHVHSIQLTNFKNYQSESFQFNAKYNAIVGFNGMGKTNILDAIYYSCMTKSNFVNRDSNLIYEGAEFLRTVAVMDDKKIVSKIEKGKKKVFEVNGKAYERLTDHVGKFPVVFIVPGDQNLLLEGSAERRKFLDNTISQVDILYLRNLLTYNALLQQRNAYLKMVSGTGRFTKEMALTYTKQMVEPLNYIKDRRQGFIGEFEGVFQKKYATISGGQESGSCSYKTQLSGGDFWQMTLESLDKDRILGRTSIGIHKDDLVFKMDGKSVKQFASQGQTKSFIIALKLSQYKFLANEKGIKPILLLDDLFDKLDHNRVQQLIELLEAEEVGQVFISDTDTNRVVQILENMKVDYRKMVIVNGKNTGKAYASEEE